jgi:diguanylate cyclase (GGDEF)-like protein
MNFSPEAMVVLDVLYKSIECAPRSMMVVDCDMRIVTMNRRARRFPSLEIGKDLLDTLDECDEGITRALRQACRTSRAVPLRLTLLGRPMTFTAWRINPLPGLEQPLVMLKSDPANSFAAQLSKVQEDHNTVSRKLASVEDAHDRLRRYAKRLKVLAQTDPLTGLFNGEAFMKRCTESLNDGHSGVFLFIDLNDFKPVNDQLGHDAGDYVLQVIAARLREETRRRDIVGRLGGDEFAIWLEDADDVILQDMQKRLHHLLSPPVLWKSATGSQHRISVSGSFGAALAPQNGVNAETLRRYADLDMYAKKAEFKRAHA